MSSLVERMDQGFYPRYQNNWDDLLFREWVSEHVTSEVDMLDLGAGAGIVPHMNFRGIARRVCGVDLDPRILENPFLDEAKVADVCSLPYSQQTFDLVIANNVLEHLEAPLFAFKEVERVLKRGGVFLFKTPNKWHYVSTIGRFTPHSFHRWTNRVRGRAEVDTFPTRYRVNTRQAVEYLAVASGFRVEQIDRIEGRPEYCRMSWPTYLLGVTYERLVNSSEVFAPFRVLLMGKLSKDRGPS
jgi:SAM-dependent methyltransferase